ncbi:ArsR family transcriptional regulator [Burkholderia anthina]|uniref:VpaChn25_0724 family phage protein n=1 Tax=Burkholderia anthina TaxID=179879 RepID=UPI00158D3B2D|nr:ArsR family transcriptional regulator [Burkholderia anthina]
MKRDFATHLAEDRRLVILRVLMDSAAYTTNEFILLDLVNRFGHVVSTDRLHADLDWLQEQELLTFDIVADVRIAKLTVRGVDVAAGRAVVTGVKRPRPE